MPETTDGVTFDSITEDGVTFFEMVAWPDGEHRVGRFVVYEVTPRLDTAPESVAVAEGVVVPGSGGVHWHPPDGGVRARSLEQFARFMGALAGAVAMAAGCADKADVLWMEAARDATEVVDPPPNVY